MRTLSEKLFYDVRAPSSAKGCLSSDREICYQWDRTPRRLKALLGSTFKKGSSVRVELTSGGGASSWRPLWGTKKLFMCVCPSEDYSNALFSFRWKRCGKWVLKTESAVHGMKMCLKKAAVAQGVECRAASVFPLLIISY